MEKKVVFDLCASCQLATNYDIYLFDTQTQEVTKLTQHMASDTNPTWSPDGNRIAFVSGRDYPEEGGSDIYIIEIVAGTIIRITQTGNAGRQLWTPNGQEFIYWSENNLYKIELSTLESVMIPLGVEGNTGFRPFSLSPDGQKILLHVFSYTSTFKDQSLQQLDLGNGALTPIYSGKGINGVDWISRQNK
jgi:tricorn protease-like protein